MKKKMQINFLRIWRSLSLFWRRHEFGKSSINFGVYGIPESILVNNDLKIIKKFIGPLNQKTKQVY